MCRFLLFVGREPILLADLLTRPAHSIINQSFDSKLRVDLRRPLNGDGFGVGWYNVDVIKHEASVLKEKEHGCTRITIVRGGSAENVDHYASHHLLETQNVSCTAKNSQEDFNLLNIYSAPNGPCVFTSILPAWNNLNLIRISEKIRSKLIFAHVRAATPGFPISETNCHPWSYGRWLWMHNGFIAHFSKIKRNLQTLLRDEIYMFVQGSTDSEWVFALFLNQFDDPLKKDYLYKDINSAMLRTIEIINQLLHQAGIFELSLMNFAVTNGDVTVCTRYANVKGAEPASLFFSSGSRFEPEVVNDSVKSGSYRMVKSDKRENIVIVSSEPLTHERNDWISIPANTMLTITPKLNVLLTPIKFL